MAFGIFQIAAHHDIAAEHHFADGLAVGRHRLHGFGVQHRQLFQRGIAHALARLLGGAAGAVQRVPFLMPFIDHGGAIDFGQAIDMHHFKAGLRHRRQHAFGRRRGGGHEAHFLRKAFALGIRGVDQGAHHNGRAAQMGDAMFGQRIEDRARPHPAQADMGARHRRQRPGHAPAVAVEHRQGPQQHGMLDHGAGQRIAVAHQGGAAMVIDHALGIPGGAGGVIQGDGVPFVVGHRPGKIRIAGFQEFLVIDLSQPRAALRKFRVVIIDHQRLLLQQLQRRRPRWRKIPGR